MVWDVIGIFEVRRPEEYFTTLQSGHLLYHSKANNGQAGVCFLINRKWKDHIVRVNSISPRVAVHNKALQTKDSATNNIILRKRRK